jgi:AAA15 family ATPase/GTPase
MIKSLQIKNFKSIRQISIPCRKLNVFIGEPNSGKSNILEALALKSQNAAGWHINLNEQIFRYKTVGDLFYDFNINEPIEVSADDWKASLEYSIQPDGSIENVFSLSIEDSGQKHKIQIGHDGKVTSSNILPATNIRYYAFQRPTQFSLGRFQHLSVPGGDNLPSLLLANASHKKWVSDFLQSKGLTLTLKPTENDLSASKLVDGAIYSYPYSTLSETLQRVVFYNMAIRSNQNSVLLFDEPETNTFPFYTKFIAERIALDETNQFFITTHNPYLLLSLIEKSGLQHINVGVTEMQDYQTTVTLLNEKQITQLLDLNSDAFFNLPQILGR